MSEELMLDVGQANEIKLAARRAGATSADLKRLCEGDMFAQILPALRGLGEITIAKYIVDLNARPFVPVGLKIVEHNKGGKFEFDQQRIALHLDNRQRGDHRIVGHQLRAKLARKNVFNANLLDFYLKHPNLIPEEWKSENIYFWGTIFSGPGGKLYVRHLYWRSGRLDWANSQLGFAYGRYDHAAVLVA